MVFLRRDRRRHDQREFKLDTSPLTVPNEIGTYGVRKYATRFHEGGRDCFGSMPRWGSAE